MTAQLSWKVGSWSSCQSYASNLSTTEDLRLKRRSNSCSSGQRGVQHRKASCFWKANKQKVDLEICTSTIKDFPLLRRLCVLPCPQDCVVGLFDTWLTECDA